MLRSSIAMRRPSRPLNISLNQIFIQQDEDAQNDDELL